MEQTFYLRDGTGMQGHAYAAPLFLTGGHSLFCADLLLDNNTGHGFAIPSPFLPCAAFAFAHRAGYIVTLFAGINDLWPLVRRFLSVV